MRSITLLVICLSLGACANSPAKRFEPLRSQVSENNQIDVVIDSFGLNDIKGPIAGFDPERNKVFSENLQQAIVTSLEEKGYNAKILSATMGVHAQEYVGEEQIVHAIGNEPTEQFWNGPILPEASTAWGDESLINYFDTAFTETKYVNYKKGNKLIEFLNAPGGREGAAQHRYAISAEGEALRKETMQNMPDVLAASTADTILFMKVAGYEVHRGKAAAASLTIGLLTAGASGGTSMTLATYSSAAPMELVAIDQDTGQVLWTNSFRAGRYSNSPDQIAQLLTNYPAASN